MKLPTGAHLVWIKHPWKKSYKLLKVKPMLKNDFDYHIRNMTWWNNYEPCYYKKLSTGHASNYI